MDKIVFELHFEDVALISSLQIGCLEVDSLLLKLGHLCSVQLAFGQYFSTEVHEELFRDIFGFFSYFERNGGRSCILVQPFSKREGYVVADSINTSESSFSFILCELNSLPIIWIHQPFGVLEATWLFRSLKLAVEQQSSDDSSRGSDSCDKG